MSFSCKGKPKSKHKGRTKKVPCFLTFQICMVYLYIFISIYTDI